MSSLDDILDLHSKAAANRNDALEVVARSNQATDSAFSAALRTAAASEKTIIQLREELADHKYGTDPDPDPPSPGPDPDPDPPKPPPSDDPLDEVFERAGRSLDENIADARARHEARKVTPSRVQPTTLTRSSSEPWVIQDRLIRPNYQWGLNRSLHEDRDVFTREPASDLERLARFGCETFLPVPTTSNTQLRALEMGALHGAAATDRIKWFARLYNNRRLLVEDVTANGARDDGHFGSVVMEHGVYAEVQKSFRMRRCFWDSLEGHGAYFAYRPMDFQQYGPSNLYAVEQMLFAVEDTICVNTDMGVGRGSRAVEAFNVGDYLHPGLMILEDVEVYGRWDFIRSQSRWDPIPVEAGFQPSMSGRNMNAAGAFGLHHFDVAKHIERAQLAESMGLGQVASHPTDLVRITRPTFDLSFSRTPFGFVRGAKRFVLEDGFCRADARHLSPWIHVDDDQALRDVSGCRQIVVRNQILEKVGVRKHVDGGSIDLPPGDYRGKAAIWRPGMGQFEIRDLDPARSYGEAS